MIAIESCITNFFLPGLGVGWECLVDILVTTPGRLVEHLYSTPGFSLGHLRYLVIDEADRIVDNIQNNWLHHLDLHITTSQLISVLSSPNANWPLSWEFFESQIKFLISNPMIRLGGTDLPKRSCPLLTLHNLNTLPRRPQKLLFSATLSIDPEKLSQLNLFQPRLFTSVVEATKDQGGEGEFIGKFTTPAELQEHMVRCTQVVKPLVLYRLITREGWRRVLVFTHSSRTGHQLTGVLATLAHNTQQPFTVAEISAECSPKTREATLLRFAAGNIDV
ncbi:ATP-dependent RNA helicase ddx51 [Homalodisca vitripennis]|nr:ATP-dependent RNA helicase ddx51 [Homalodisca vitripennis]